MLSVVKKVGAEFIAGTSCTLDVLLGLLPPARKRGSKEK